jgi:hypothetical protein
MKDPLDFELPPEEEDEFGVARDRLFSGHDNIPIEVVRLMTWLIDKYPHALLDEFLERGFPWPSDLPWDKSVFVSQDDTDGRVSGFWIAMAKDGDIWADFDIQAFDDNKRFSMSNNLRFRTFGGGTKNPRMNAALRILIFACLKDSLGSMFINDPETGRPLGWGEMRDAEKRTTEDEGAE